MSKDDDIQVKVKSEYDSDDEDDKNLGVTDAEVAEENYREYKEVLEGATLDDIKEIADILGISFQVTYSLYNVPQKR